MDNKQQRKKNTNFSDPRTEGRKTGYKTALINEHPLRNGANVNKLQSEEKWMKEDDAVKHV